MIWRPLTTGDAPAMARAYAAIEAVDRTGEHYSERDVREVLEDETIDLARDSIAAVDDDGAIVAFTWLHGSADVHDLDRVDTDGGVLPAARRSGLGRRLLEWAEERAASLHRERHPEVPGAVIFHVHENNPGKQALVRAAGYTEVRWQYRMVRAVDGRLPDVPATPAGFTLTPYQAERDEEVRQAHRETFAGQWGVIPPDEGTWAHWYTGSQPFRPDVSWLVLHDDEIAAYLLSYFWEADTAATGVREAYLGQLGVRPAWRRRGLGEFLLATGLHSYRSAGYERTSLTVDSDNPTGARGLYERLGFTTRDASVTWMKSLA